MTPVDHRQNPDTHLPEKAGQIDAAAHAQQGEMHIRWPRLPLFMLVAVLSLMLVFDTAVRVSRQLETLRTSRNDNLNYVVTQLEVESLDFNLAVKNAQLRRTGLGREGGTDAPDALRKSQNALRHLRVRFDIFYSRVNILRNGVAYRTILASGGDGALDVLLNFLDKTVPLMDGPDADLIAYLPRLEVELIALRSVTRQLATQAIAANAATEEKGRQEISRLLGRLALQSTVLIASFLALMLMLWRLYRQNRMRAVENRATSARLSTILATSPDAIIVTRGEGLITDVNAAAQAMFGLTAEDAKGKWIGRLVKEGQFESSEQDGSTLSGFTPEVEAGARSNLHLVGRRAGGGFFPVELSTGIAQLRNAPHCVLFLRDISERVTARRELEESRDQALAGERAKSRFMAVMSHEMRTPLNGILGVLDLLHEKKVDAETREFLDVMEGSGQALLGHVNDVLDIARLEAEGVTLRKSDFDLDRLARTLIAGLAPAAKARGNTLEMVCSPDPLGRWRGDPARLRQVLTNILGNAVKFTRDGHIALDLSLVTNPDGSAWLEVQITDTGRGIAPEALEQVFDDFVRVESENEPQEEGTGLGLGIARRLVVAMGGEIGAQSEHGEGSLFWINLPLDAPNDRPAVTKGAGDAENTADQIARQKVLMVEDNATNRFILREMLRREGQDVVEAVNGIEGVKQAESQCFDLILMDISMPLMNGLDATRAIRAGDGPSSDARIVALTAHVIGDDRDRYDQAGMDDVATKPLNLKGLRRILAGKATTPQPAPETRLALLDQDVLSGLAAAMSRVRLVTLLQGFLDEGNAFEQALPDLITQAEHAEETATKVHYFAGLAATLGARRVHAALVAVETDLKAQNVAQARKGLAEFAPLWQLTLERIHSYMV